MSKTTSYLAYPARKKTTYDSSTKTWSGSKPNAFYHLNVNVADVLMHHLSLRPNHVGQINDNNGDRMTNDQLRLNSIRVAQQMHTMGVQKDDVIAVMTNRHHPYVSSIIVGTFALAASIFAVDPSSSADNIASMIKLSKIRLFFCDHEWLFAVQEAIQLVDTTNVEIILFDEHVEGYRVAREFLEPTNQEELFVATEVIDGTRQTAVINMSSGTTGPPKAICTSHAKIISREKAFPVNSEDVYFSFSPVNHSTSIMALTLCMMNGITRIITTEPFRPDLAFDIIERHRVTKFFAIPYTLSQMFSCTTAHRRNLSGLRTYTGGNMMPKALLNRINEILPHRICNVYGFTEFGNFVSINELGIPIDSVGVLNEGVSMRIVDESGNRCGVGEEGELLVWSAVPSIGYFGNAKGNNEILLDDGWLRTGDIGRFDSDGFLYFVNRQKDIIWSRGTTSIYPSIIEHLIAQLDGVAGVSVVGVPDLELIEVPAAVVVRDKVGTKISEQDIRMAITENFSNLHELRGGVYFVEKLPYTASGKIKKKIVLELIMQSHTKQSNHDDKVLP